MRPWYPFTDFLVNRLRIVFLRGVSYPLSERIAMLIFDLLAAQDLAACRK